MPKEKKTFTYWLNEWESYLSAATFMVITVLLLGQVISRYIFNASITWLEELSTFLFLVMIYTGVAAAVTHRKQICIDALPMAMPFKVKKFLLILADVIFIVFCVWIQKGLFDIIRMMTGGATPLLHIPYALCYLVVSLGLILTGIRCVQDIVRLYREEEHQLGYKKPTIDLEACEAEYRASLKKGGE